MNWLKGWHLLFDEYNACFTAIEAGWTSFIVPHVLFDENNACFTAIEAGWTSFNLLHVFFDENNTILNAIEAGRTDLKVDTYYSMKIMISLQSKLDELI